MPKKYSPLWHKGLCYVVALVTLLAEYMLNASVWVMFGHAVINVLIAELLIDTSDSQNSEEERPQ